MPATMGGEVVLDPSASDTLRCKDEGRSDTSPGWSTGKSPIV
jgi:hypothetical protein